jgi:hypothetical protein
MRMDLTRSKTKEAEKHADLKLVIAERGGIRGADQHVHIVRILAGQPLEGPRLVVVVQLVEPVNHDVSAHGITPHQHPASRGGQESKEEMVNWD